VIGVVLNLISTYDTRLHLDLDRVRLPVALALILIVLLARPRGLFGRQVVRRV
jgi:branched-subunit amino acid ABC-type transport system permease component